MSGGSKSTEEWVRARLRKAVEEVEPSPDALPRMLARARRRDRTRVPALTTLGLVTAVCTVCAVMLVGWPQFGGTQSVSVHENSYVASAEPGVLASFDIVSGDHNQDLVRFPDTQVHAAVGSGDRVYASLSGPDGRRIVVVGEDGGWRTVVETSAAVDASVLAAGNGQVAYLERQGERESIVLARDSARRDIPVPEGERVHDLAVGDDGRIAVLLGTPNGGDEEVRVLEPEAATLDVPPVSGLRTAECGPVAVTWSGSRVAALGPVDCAAEEFRVTIVNGTSGSIVGAGVPFPAGSLPAESPRLSTDRLGRFLVSTGQQQWLVDGSDVRPVPEACVSEQCARLPATLWG